MTALLVLLLGIVGVAVVLGLYVAIVRLLFYAFSEDGIR